MSTETILWIICDRCGARWHSAQTPAAARKDAHAAGWSVDKANDKDYCSVCTNDRIGQVYGANQLRLPFEKLPPPLPAPAVKSKTVCIEHDFGITHIVIGEEK